MILLYSTGSYRTKVHEAYQGRWGFYQVFSREFSVWIWEMTIAKVFYLCMCVCMYDYMFVWLYLCITSTICMYKEGFLSNPLNFRILFEFHIRDQLSEWKLHCSICEVWSSSLQTHGLSVQYGALPDRKMKTMQ